MKFKKICGLILTVVAAGLTSCSSDLNNEEKVSVSPNETAKRTLSISTGNAKTRSEVNIDAGNKWVAGDRFMAYNRTFTGDAAESRYGILTAHNAGEKTSLDGTIACKNNDMLGIFYPGTYSTGFEQGKLPVIMTKSYINGNKEQDGSEENLKYFDYSYGTGTVTVNGSSASGLIDMKKLYSIMELDFTVNGVKLTNVKKLVLSNVYTEGVYNLQEAKLENLETGSIEVNSPVSLEKVYVAILPQKDFKPTFEVYTDDNKAYRFSIVTPSYNLIAAKVYPFTVPVKEFTPNPPYIEINGVKWGKYNLQYSTGTKVDGWVDGYHLAENPWDYYTTDDVKTPLTGDRTPMTPNPFDPNNVQFDHFRWGDIEKAYDYRYAAKTHYWDTTNDISRVVKSDKEYGDLATYASNDKWRLPKAQEFDNLMLNTAEYIGYYVNDKGNTIYGVLFDPNVPQNLKNKVVDKNNVVIRTSNQPGSATINKDRLRKFEKSDFESALFFPMAGVYDDYNNISKVGTQAGYWTSTSFSSTQAKAFMPQVFNNGSTTQVFGGLTNTRLVKSNMYSIRPIYIGQ